jgi:NAD(P)-dependent dehydrogenase (short-subunit alcohol dehydrogenase family)
MDLITTPYDATTRAGDIVANLDLSRQRVIVTGGASGIGAETVRALAAAGASVTVAVRDLSSGERFAREVAADTGNDRVTAASLDLTDDDSIRRFCTDWQGPVDVLINNAGVMAVPELTLSFDGHEVQFATNHLGHFALTVGLHRALAAAQGARVVSVSSAAHYFSPVVFDDVDFENRPYDRWSAYGQSKTANILHAIEITERWSNEGIVANALHPGVIATNLQRHTGPLRMPVEHQKTPEQGAATSVLLAVSPLLDGVGGRYLEDCNESPVVADYVRYSPGVAPFAKDPESANRLWELSLAFLDASRD